MFKTFPEPGSEKADSIKIESTTIWKINLKTHKWKKKQVRVRTYMSISYIFDDISNLLSA